MNLTRNFVPWECKIRHPPEKAPNMLRSRMIEEIAKHEGLRFHQKSARSGECHSMS